MGFSGNQRIRTETKCKVQYFCFIGWNNWVFSKQGSEITQFDDSGGIVSFSIVVLTTVPHIREFLL